MPEAIETSCMGQRRRNTDEIQQVVQQYRGSGLTQAEFCRQSGLVLSTLGRYLRRGTSGEQKLVRVEVAAAEPQGGFVLTLSNGRRIAGAWKFDSAELTRLIRVAETA